jgi:hypothetical protein
MISSAARIIALQVHGNQAFDHIALALPDFGHIDRSETRRGPKPCGVAHQICDLGAPDLILARETIGVRAGAANPSALHDGSTSPRLRHVPGQVLTPLSTAKDKGVESFWLSHD